MNRREFIEVSGASLLVASAGSLKALAPEGDRPWYETMLRCGQVNFNEQDPASMKTDEWIDCIAQWRRNHGLLSHASPLSTS
jgi:hypothetical protein